MAGRRKVSGAIVATLAALVVCASLVGVNVPPAAAQPCPDAEVVFARGTSEAPGVGGVGQAFVDSVRAQAGPRTVGVYGVNYPASDEFFDRVGFASTVVAGIRDTLDHVQAMAVNCPDTRLVLGGFSQGAVVAGFATAAEVPDGVSVEAVPPPMPPEVADHVAAVVLFATPSAQYLSNFDAPAVAIGPLFVPKTLQICDPGDSICSGVAGGGPNIAHALYAVNGSVNEGAAFAVERL
ncbi:MAG: cutinase family protein [Actinomycetia bacterium]|nr:cutinase family protein [Actinomycetes bacterium]MCH9701624.1 cutinase family protein [Actinomycetes bacterium]MCH9759807.1 cutinase family protein [Actinomycetes bacterium]